MPEKAELAILAWKGGVKEKLQIERKLGTLQYLATWQGLRGEDLDLSLQGECVIVCARTGQVVVFSARETDDEEKLVIVDVSQEQSFCDRATARRGPQWSLSPWTLRPQMPTVRQFAKLVSPVHKTAWQQLTSSQPWLTQRTISIPSISNHGITEDMVKGSPAFPQLRKNYDAAFEAESS